MTGYGRGENASAERKFTVEIKAVNHRYNDISIKLPRAMSYLEDRIRKRLMQSIFRGKTDVYINVETFPGADVRVNVNEALADAYMERLRYLEERYELDEDEGLLPILVRFPEVITTERIEADEDALWNTLSPALEEAAEKFVAMRTVEGEALKTDILKKADAIEALVDQVKERAPLVVGEYRDRLQARLKELMDGVDIDPQRLAAEVTVFADRGCIDEELTRLDSHIVQLRSILNGGGQVGRKLDFLIQEMNREANTIASKANDIQITRATIDLKSEIEKIREQVQNIE